MITGLLIISKKQEENKYSSMDLWVNTWDVFIKCNAVKENKLLPHAVTFINIRNTM